ncbi:unnamed protein product [Alopecurus aequalis]
MAERREIPQRVAGGRVEHLVEVLLEAVHGVQGCRDPPLHLHPLELRHPGSWSSARLLGRRRWWRAGVDGGEAVQRRELAERRRVEHPRLELVGAGDRSKVRPVHLPGVQCAAASLHGAAVTAERAAATAGARATTSTIHAIATAIAIACGGGGGGGGSGGRRGGGGEHLGGCGGQPGLLELLVVEEPPDADSERAVRRDAGREVGARLGAAEEAGGLVVGARGGVGGLEGAEPHADLLRGVLDLGHPAARRPLADADELAVAAAALLPAPRLGRLGCQRRGGFLLLLVLVLVVVAVVLHLDRGLHLEVELHLE